MAAALQRAPGAALLGRPRAVAAARPSRAVVRPQAGLFGFGGGAKKSDAGAAAPSYFICIDCGWICPDEGAAFKKLPGSFRCPVCNSPKSRFKVYKGAVRGKPNNSGSALKQRFQAREW